MAGEVEMRIKLWNCYLFISPVFMGMITLFLLIDQTGLMNGLLVAMLIHELGHLVMMILLGYPPREVRFLPFEINVIADQSTASSYERFCISVGGIVANLLVGFAFLGKPFGYVNFYLALFNALPLYSMDGYQILSLLAGQKRKIVFWISAGITLMVLGVGLWLLIGKNNPMLLLFGIYLFSLGFMEKRKGTSG